jgi:hypothetical protein
MTTPGQSGRDWSGLIGFSVIGIAGDGRAGVVRHPLPNASVHSPVKATSVFGCIEMLLLWRKVVANCRFALG